jgi:hypothetical protein
MDYPTLAQVAAADRVQVCRWWRFLAGPDTDEKLKIMSAIAKKFNEYGGMTPEISKQINLEQN